MGFTDISALDSAGLALRQYSAPGVFNANGSLQASLEMPVGSRLLRVDTFVSVNAATPALTFTIFFSGTGGSNGSLANFFTPLTAVPGFVQATHAPATPLTVGAGQRLYIQTSNCTSANRVWRGAVYQYFDANPQLNLLTGPIRSATRGLAPTPPLWSKARWPTKQRASLTAPLAGQYLSAPRPP